MVVCVFVHWLHVNYLWLKKAIITFTCVFINLFLLPSLFHTTPSIFLSFILSMINLYSQCKHLRFYYISNFRYFILSYHIILCSFSFMLFCTDVRTVGQNLILRIISNAFKMFWMKKIIEGSHHTFLLSFLLFSSFLNRFFFLYFITWKTNEVVIRLCRNLYGDTSDRIHQH